VFKKTWRLSPPGGASPSSGDPPIRRPLSPCPDQAFTQGEIEKTTKPTMKRINPIRIAGATLLLFALGQPIAQAYTHPYIPHTSADLAYMKANLDKEPWKSGYALLANASTAGLSWTMDGPYVNVSREGAYDQSLTPWRNSMNAVYNLARM
jgi:hypothetical protein